MHIIDQYLPKIAEKIVVFELHPVQTNWQRWAFRNFSGLNERDRVSVSSKTVVTLYP